MDHTLEGLSEEVLSHGFLWDGWSHRKFRRYFKESLVKISAQRLNLSEILPKCSKFWKICNFKKFDKNKNIGEHSICNFSTNFFGGQRNSSGKR